MRTSLGISAGNEVVCSATVATAPNGAQTFDYRVVSADAAHSDLGDLVTSSIELMTTQLPATHPREPVHPVGARFTERPEPIHAEAPTSVAVAYRGKEQEQIIRAATGRQRELRLVPEFTAALTYLRHTGLLDRYATVAVVDLGATGLTVTVADRADGAVLVAERTSVLSGNAIDELIYRHLVDQHFARRGTRPNRHTLVNRARAAKEHLSVTPAVTVDHVAGRPLKLTREDFEYLIEDLLRDIAHFTAIAAERAERLPEAVTVIGGGANIPAVLSALHDRLGIPVLTVPDPDAVIAKGAALVADQAQTLPEAPVAAVRADTSGRTVTKVAGVLAGALVVVGLVIGYGVREFAPIADEEVSPAGTTSSGGVPATTAPPVPTSQAGVPGSTAEPPAPTSATTPPAVTTSQPVGPTSPTLRPDPNNPPIPFPNSLGPGLELPSTAPTRTVSPSSVPPNAQVPAENSMPLPPQADTGSAGGTTATAQSSAPLPTLAIPR